MNPRSAVATARRATAANVPDFPVLLAAAAILTVGATWAMLTHPGPALAVAVVAIVGLITIDVPMAPSFIAFLLAFSTVPAFVPVTISLPGFSGRTYEPVMAVALLAVLRTHSYCAPALRGAVIIVGTLVLWSAFGVVEGNPTYAIVHDARFVFYLAVAMIAASDQRLVDRWRTGLGLLTFVLWFSAIVSIGASLSLFEIAGREGVASLDPSAGDASAAIRLLSPVTYLALVVVCVLIPLSLQRHLSRRLAWQLGLPSLLLIVLSFTRNSLVGIATTIVVTVVVAARADVVVRAVRLVVGIVLGAVAFVALVRVVPEFSGTRWAATQITSYKDRVLGGFSSSALASDGSVQFRLRQENTYLIPQIERSPVLGHGLGFAYKPLFTGRFLGDKSDYLRYYAHNFYLWIWVKTGLIGMGAIVLGMVMPLVGAFRRRTPLAIGLASAACGLLVCSLVAPMPNGSPTSVLLGGLLGLCASSAVASPEVGSSEAAVAITDGEKGDR